MPKNLPIKIEVEVDQEGNRTLLITPERKDKTVIRLFRDLIDKLETKDYDLISPTEEEKRAARSWKRKVNL